ncbi:MAG TPA: diguanylate cyclase [Thermomicrobiales bacterium]|nr:diguanylate cyclase [Thermomicrobiales bacterium]
MAVLPEDRRLRRGARPARGAARLGEPAAILSGLARARAANRASPTSIDNLALERRIIQIRWLGMALCAVAAPFLGLGGHAAAVYLCLGAIGLYNLAFRRLVAIGRPVWLLRAYAYGFFDIVMATAIIAATGGGASPFYLAYFPIVVHAAIRFGRRVAILSSLVTALCYLGVIGLENGLATPFAGILFNVGFVALTAVFAGLLSDRTHAAELALAQQLDQARALNVAGSILTGSLDWAMVARQVAEQGRLLAGADAAILELGAARAGVGDVGRFAAGQRVTDAPPGGAYLAKMVLQSDLLAGLPAPASDRITIHDLAALGRAASLPAASLLRAPLRVQGRWVGDLFLLRAAPAPPFVARDAGLVRAFANQATLALENAWLYGHAREQAATDPITELPNHRSLKERLDEELARARRHGLTLCVLMLDIDHFKSFNDAFGHAAGDLALQVVAGALRRALRRGDYAARYAGEEFVLILPETTAQTGALIADRLRAAVAGLIDEPDCALPGPVTVSIGVAAFPEHGVDRDLLLQAADLAMYLAKHIGRNQVCLANELGTARGLDALFAQLTSHLALPTARWGPHLVTDLERRFTRLASLRVDPDERNLAEGAEAAYHYTVQTVTALAATIDAKDHYTEGHSRHVAALAVQLARAAGLPREAVEQIHVGGLLHDIGKIGIPEAILNKPGRLTDDEWPLMRSHPDIGARILAPIAALGGVIPLVRHHHERWDGQGYPLRLEGEHIPVGARIIAICDAYDTMVSDRPYRHGLGHAAAVARLRAAAGAQFDPRLVDLFAALPLDADQPRRAPLVAGAAGE